MLDVLVTCHPHAGEPSDFPQVRGFYLAKHLARSGLRPSSTACPCRARSAGCSICSEYQCGERDWFERHLAGPLSEIRADRWFCLTAYSIGDQDHFSREYLDWFAARGGILCHQEEPPLGAAEHVIGLGVDIEALDDLGATPRDSVVFDFAELVSRPDAVFDRSILDAVREAQLDCRVVGTGPAGAAVSTFFDDWVPYAQPHPEYIRAVLPRAFAFVSGLLGHAESMGLAVAEAQSAGERRSTGEAR